MKVIRLMLATAAISALALASCNKKPEEPTPNPNPNPNPQPRNCQLATISGHGVQIIHVEHNAQGQYVSVAQMLRPEDGTYHFAWEEGHPKSATFETSTGHTYRYEYNWTAGRLTKADIFLHETNQKQGEYRYQWDSENRLTKLTFYQESTSREESRAMFEYDSSAKNYKSIKVQMQGSPGVWATDKSFDFTWDDKLNPLREQALVFPQILEKDGIFMTATPNNPLTVTEYGPEGQVGREITHTYTYNSDNYPATSATTGLPVPATLNWSYLCK